MNNVVKVVAYKGQHRITIPKELAEDKGWAAGTSLRFIELPDGSVLLRKAGNADERD